MRRFGKDDRGMTLIELLIAIAILGFVAVPLLRGFLTSAQTEVKARKMSEVTSVAQNIMETIEGNRFEDLVVNGSSIFGVESEVRLSGDDYQIKLPNIVSHLEGRTYNAVVDIEPLDDINNKELSEYTAMDVVFQVGKSKVESDRTITLIVKMNGNDKIDFELSYDVAEADAPVGDQTEKPDVSVDGEGSEETGDENETSKTELPKELYTYAMADENDIPIVYLFYYPSYKIDNGPVICQDSIDIVNKDDIEFDLFIVKQQDTGMALSNLDACELRSKCYVKQTLSGIGTYTSGIGANIYTNIRECLCYTAGSTTCSKTNGILANDNLKYELYWGDELRPNISLKDNTFSSLVKERSHLRAYEYTVRIYDHTEEVLCTMAGTILK